MMNVSFFVCALAVDISNILGNSLYGLFQGSDFAMSASGGGLESIADGVLGIGTAAVGGYLIFSNIGALLVAILAGLVGVAVGLLALLVRQFGIMVLVIFAPIAIVCNVFPNLDKWYKKWQQAFITLLMVYPVIGAVMGLSKFVSDIIKVSGDDQLTQIAGSIIALLPAVAIPSLSKSSIRGLGELGGKISGALNTIEGKGRQRAETGSFGQLKAAQQRKQAQNRQLANTGNYKGWNPVLRSRSAITGGSLKMGTRLPRAMGGNLATSISAAGIAASNKEEEMLISERQELYNRNYGTDISKLQEAYEKATVSGDGTSAKAISNLLMAQGGKGIESLATAHIKLDNVELSKSGQKTFSDSKEYLQKDYSKIKEKNAAFATSLASGKTVESAYQEASTFTGLSKQALSQQSSSTLNQMYTNYDNYSDEEQLQLSSMADAIRKEPKLTQNMDTEQLETIYKIADQKEINQATVDLSKEKQELVDYGVDQVKIDNVVEERRVDLKADEARNLSHNYMNKKHNLNRLGYSDSSPQVQRLTDRYDRIHQERSNKIDKKIK